MDDEEYSYASLQEPLYRVETGNYEYRYVRRLDGTSTGLVRTALRRYHYRYIPFRRYAYG